MSHASNNVTHTKVMVPVNFVGSTPPKVSSPFVTLVEVVGSNDMPSISFGIKPAENALSVTVGMVPPTVVVSNEDKS